MYLSAPAMAERCQMACLTHPTLRDTMRLSRIRHHIVLVAASREPMPPAEIAAMIANDVVDYAAPEALDSLATRAARNAHSSLLARSTRYLA